MVGRCMYIFIMYDSSVWVLFLDDFLLYIFYSVDRLGLVVKMDVRGMNGEFDNGLLLVVV